MRRCTGERGATLVESAIITPILMLFLFAIFEFGFAFRDYLTVANATRDGVRAVSVAGDVGDADYQMLRSIRRASTALPDDGLDLVVVFEADDGPTSTVPPACAAGNPVPNVCNVYTPSQLSLPVSDFGCQRVSNGDPLDSPDRHWCPNDRETSVGTGLDYVGVYIEGSHDYITGLFGSSVTFKDLMILKVEPQSE